MSATKPASGSTNDVGVILAMDARAASRGAAPWHRRLLNDRFGVAGLVLLTMMVVACIGSLPWLAWPRPVEETMSGGGSGSGTTASSVRVPEAAYERQDRNARHLPPFWWPVSDRAGASDDAAARRVASGRHPALGTDVLGRDLLARCLVGGAISLAVGILAATIAVVVGTLYGALAAYCGGVVDSVMMRVVDVLYGLPYVLLVVLLAVAGDAVVEEYAGRVRARQAWLTQRTAEVMAAEGQAGTTAAGVLPSAARERLANDKELASRLASEAELQPSLRRREIGPGVRTCLDLGTLLLAIGGVSWLTMARVVRGQVLTLKSQPFVEAARAMGMSGPRIFVRHLLPNLLGPITVYATLTVPQAILQESFLSFLGIGVKPPLPSWGNLAADGLEQLNLVQSHWWLLVFPCGLLALTLLSLNFVGEAARNILDPRGA